jgi:hypothetical protein
MFDSTAEITFKNGNKYNFCSHGEEGLVGTFKVEGVGYRILAIKMSLKPGEDMIHAKMKDQPIDDNTWFLGFTTDSGDGGVTGTGHAAKVFGIVSNAYMDLMVKLKPSYVYFGAEDSSSARKKIYERLAQKVIPKIGGTIIAKKTASFFGSPKALWIVKGSNAE